MNARLCRRRHSEQERKLEQAVALAARAERVHRQDDAWPHGLLDQVEDILERTVIHQQREQSVVFPMLMTGVAALPDKAIDDMIAAHEDLARRWRRLDQRTEGFRAPPHACETWRSLYALCDRLHLDWQAEVDLENRMLLAGRPGGLRNDTEARVAHAQRP